MKARSRLRNLGTFVLLSGGIVLAGPSARSATEPLFQFNILAVHGTAPGSFPTFTFSVTDPTTGAKYDLTTDPAFTAPGVSSLTLQISWDTRDYTNTTDYNTTTGYLHDPGNSCKSLAPFSRFGNGAAYPIPLSVITGTPTQGRGLLAPNVIINNDQTYAVPSRCPLPVNATGTGAVGMYGRAAGQDAAGVYTERVRVTSVVKYFPITDPPASLVERRVVVNVAKCLNCHGAMKSDGTLWAPVFSFHGEARTNEPKLCVICHNPEQTDIPFRKPGDPTSGDGPETSVDFKRMVHGIHATAAGFRHSSYTIIGFNHSINAFTDYEFPGELRNCLTCHIDQDATHRLGTFELPLGPKVLGTTVDTRSTYTQDPVTKVWRSVPDTDPANDLNITPTAAACSGCHDGSEARSHMIRTGGASFRALQSEIGYMDGSGRIVRPGKYVERCVRCHGPGKDKDVRKIHEIGSDDD